jgi:hypothetical protein
MVKKRTPPKDRKPDQHGLIYPDSRAAVVRCDRHGEVFEPCFGCQIERKMQRKREAVEKAGGEYERRDG